MSFISFSFLLLFLITFIGRFFTQRKKSQSYYLILLLIASLVFYASFVPSYLLLLLFTTSVDFYAGRKIFGTESPEMRKIYLVLSLSANLGLLAFFKYANFFLESFGGFLKLLGANAIPIPHLDLILPIGISFFTFESMSYTIDIYRRVINPEKKYWRFLLFVSFFTHLVSGPIVRAKELLYQFDRKRRIRLAVFLQGIYLMILGFFMKMVVADNLAAYVNSYWEKGGLVQMPAVVPLMLTFLFSCQIFSDFFGYSTIAMGTAYLLGFKLPVNFNSPYIAASFREFWIRWHISLSRWIRDYLYISLGGNKGSSVKVLWTLMVTMVLAGLWHGAAFTFIIWGTIHGLALATERILGLHRQDQERPRFLRMIWFVTVQFVVLVGWVFFRSENVSQGFQFLKNFLNVGYGWGDALQIAPVFLFVAPVILMHVRTFLIEHHWLKAPGPEEKALLAAFLLYCVLTLHGRNNAFLYFQF